ncbi:hypothetical protein [Alkalicoccus urumqiensis]|nr:hypothetical protein [Alkalicoccus urumqiensis]
MEDELINRVINVVISARREELGIPSYGLLSKKTHDSAYHVWTNYNGKMVHLDPVFGRDLDIEVTKVDLTEENIDEKNTADSGSAKLTHEKAKAVEIKRTICGRG